MPTQLIRPSQARKLDIRCDVGDAIVANLATHMVFFFRCHLDATALSQALSDALTALPIFAGRMTLFGGRMGIRCAGQGVPFSSVASDRTLSDALASTTNDTGLWLVDPVNGPLARWGLGAVCRVRVTHLADDATAIGFSWHHAVGDLQTVMHLMNAWSAAAAGRSPAEPLIVENRAAYLRACLPAGGAPEPGVRCLGVGETVRSLRYLTMQSRKQRTLSLYFGESEIARMRAALSGRMWLSANDVVCAVVAEALLKADPAAGRRTLAIVVNVRNRLGLDSMLAGNLITTLNREVSPDDSACSIAERIRHGVNNFVDHHCDIRVNQEFLDATNAWRAARCVSTAFDPACWNPLVTNLSGFGLYRIRFGQSVPAYCTMVMTLPVAGGGALIEGADGHGLVFQMSLPPKEFAVVASHAMREHIHRFRCADDDVPDLHRVLHG
ncbi:acyltransferase [Mycobacterium sp. M26]|uniref:acyltransferase n=1 Tax=Mycobacterium sp. M26 TaxID=1762962 RepID=UPI00073F3833|nr:acyltransferase [Mycobacterium sp. M26]